jgi:TolB-like protein/DNA-binding winged helix-turn-helix (wHTH) protein/Tfp pilus assembly protein PilF
MSPPGCWFNSSCKVIIAGDDSLRLGRRSVAQPNSSASVRFGRFDLDLRTGELRLDGTSLQLQAQPAKVLMLLVSRAGEVVTRQELARQVWGPETFVDFEQGLNFAIRQIRSALGDDADHPRFVETLPKRGYRFVAPINDTYPEATSEAVDVEAGRLNDVVRRPTWIRYRIVVAAVLLVVGGAGLYRWREKSKSSTRTIHSLAVLPLQNLSNDPEQDYFADGMTDALITSLGQIRSLRVISRTSIMQYRGVHKSLPQVARELNVDAVIEGTVVRSNGQVRITAQLIQAKTDRHLWSQSYQRDLKDVLGLQYEIANAIAKQIRLTLIPDEQMRARIDRPVNLEAYESYLRGEYFLNRFTPDSLGKAVEYFQQAIQKDPNSPAAYSKLAATYQILGETNVVPMRVAYPKARPLIAKALELDPQFASAHASRGWDLLDYELNLDAAGAELRQAVELNPNGADGHLGLSMYYAAMGELQESVQEAQRARELDPLDWSVNKTLCEQLYLARRYDEALAQCKANQDLDPSSLDALDRLGAVYAAKEMDSMAAATFIQSLEREGASPAMIAAVRSGDKEFGLKGFWTAWLKFRRTSIAAGKEDPMSIACVYTRAGDNDEALKWLEKAFKARRPWILYIGVDPIFDSLRSDPRFASLSRRIGLPPNQPKIGI